MSFWTLCEPVQDIVWDFCGDLRNPYTRRHKFVVLEVRLWSSLAPRPSDIPALRQKRVRKPTFEILPGNKQ